MSKEIITDRAWEIEIDHQLVAEEIARDPMIRSMQARIVELRAKAHMDIKQKKQSADKILEGVPAIRAQIAIHSESIRKLRSQIADIYARHSIKRKSGSKANREILQLRSKIARRRCVIRERFIKAEYDKVTSRLRRAWNDAYKDVKSHLALPETPPEFRPPAQPPQKPPVELTDVNENDTGRTNRGHQVGEDLPGGNSQVDGAEGSDH